MTSCLLHVTFLYLTLNISKVKLLQQITFRKALSLFIHDCFKEKVPDNHHTNFNAHNLYDVMNIWG